MLKCYNKCWFKICKWSQFMKVKLKFYGVMHLPRIFVLNGWSLPALNRSCLACSTNKALSVRSTPITISEIVFVRLQLYLYIAGISIRSSEELFCSSVYFLLFIIERCELDQCLYLNTKTLILKDIMFIFIT